MNKLVYVILAALFLSACEMERAATSTPAPNSRLTQAQESERLANSTTYTDNSEQQGILKRRKQMAKPGLVGYIVLLNEAGQPIANYVIDGKPISSGKRLSKPWEFKNCDMGEWGGDCVVETPSDEGVWGSSSPYIYFWEASGRYVQWSGDYLYSTQPIRLRVEPLVISQAE